MWFWRLASLGLAGILDLAAGALIVQLLSEYFAHPLLWWQYAIGAFLGASPDIDLFLGFFRKNASGHHEYPTHRPIIGIPLAVALGWLLGGEFWAYAAGVGALWHYLHDTEGFLGLSGGGIAWLWPFSKKYLGVDGFSTKVVSWKSEEYEGGEGNVYHEFSETYLMPTKRSVTEFALTSMFGWYVIAGVLSAQVATGTALFFWSCTIGLWMAYPTRPAKQ